MDNLWIEVAQRKTHVNLKVKKRTLVLRQFSEKN